MEASRAAPVYGTDVLLRRFLKKGVSTKGTDQIPWIKAYSGICTGKDLARAMAVPEARARGFKYVSSSVVGHHCVSVCVCVNAGRVGGWVWFLKLLSKYRFPHERCPLKKVACALNLPCYQSLIYKRHLALLRSWPPCAVLADLAGVKVASLLLWSSLRWPKLPGVGR